MHRQLAALALAFVVTFNLPTASAEAETWTGPTEILVGYPEVVYVDDPRMPFAIQEDMYVTVYSLPRWKDNNKTNSVVHRNASIPTVNLKKVGHELEILEGWATSCQERRRCRRINIFISDQELKVIQYPLEETDLA